MGWVVTNATWWNSFDAGDFEGGAGTLTAGPDGAYTNGSADQANTGSESLKCDLTSAVQWVAASGSGFNAQKNLFRIKPNNPIVAGRRYTGSIYIKITNLGLTNSSDIIKFLVSLGGETFPTTGIVFGDFRAIGTGVWIQLNFQFTATSSFTAGSASMAVFAKWNTAQITPPIVNNYAPLTDAIFYFDTLSIVEEEFVVVPTLALSYVKTNVTIPGGADGTIDLSVDSGTGPFTYAWSDGPVTSQDRSGLPAGSYTVTVTDTSDGAFGFTTIIISELATMSAVATVGNPTTVGGTDGTITVNVSGGSGSFTYSWGDGPTTPNRTGIAAGLYTLTITDLVTGQVFVLPVTLTDPGVVAAPGTFLDVPKMQSLEFVVQETTDNCDVLEKPDNKLLCEQGHPFFNGKRYWQKVCKCDAFPMQFNSDFENFEVSLHNHQTAAFVKSFSWSLKEQNVGVLEDYLVTIQNHTTPGQSRIYFNVGAIPIPLTVGQNFEVTNNVDGYNGFYQITGIEYDSAVGYQYLLINVNFTGPGLSSAATGRFSVSSADFNVYEAAFSVLEVPDGVYYVKIVALNTDGDMITALTEPIDLKVEHPGTNLVKFRNFDNAFGVTWTTLFNCRMRIESLLFKRFPGGERSVSRNSDYSLVKVSAQKQRILLFETYQLPPYLHEKLSVACDMDFFSINDTEFQTSEGYSEPQYLTRYALSNSSVKVEQVGWFDRYNSDDIGSVSEGGFISTETGFIKR